MEPAFPRDLRAGGDRPPSAVVFGAGLLLSSDGPCPAALAVVRDLTENVPVAVVSETSRRLLDKALARAGYAAMVAVGISSEEVEQPMPAPDALLAACAALGVTPADALAVQDSAEGIAAARAAGMPVLGVGPQGVGADVHVAELGQARWWPGVIRAATVRARVPITLERAAGCQAELVTFDGLVDQAEHLAVLAAGGPSLEGAPLVRLHSECLTGDVFGSARCDCGPQLDEALAAVARRGGAVLYLRQEGRGIGLYNKLDAYLLQDAEHDTFQANRLLGRGEDEREYRAAAQMLLALGLPRITLLTNNPEKVRQLRGYGIDVAAVEPTGTHVTAQNARYLRDKAALAGHTLDVATQEPR